LLKKKDCPPQSIIFAIHYLIMAGIYIHIPFCRQACYYCNFHFSTSHQFIPEMVSAIIVEAGLRKNYLTEKIDTIYFGGGTPSLLTIDDVKKILEKLTNIFTVDTRAEVTLEANPDDITEEKLVGWKQAGINRLSIGIQSFNDGDLQWMNRAHNSLQAITGLQLATQYFSNITIDLIYGSPTLTDEQWRKNVALALSFNIPHISCYALTVEEKTALAQLITKNKKENTDADQQVRHFNLLIRWLTEAGFEQYEISNFAKPGYRSKHNSSYWSGKPYLGLGPSAHSFNGTSRQWNIANNALYLKGIEQGELNVEKEELSDLQQLNEYLMTGLRTMEGISLPVIETKWNKELAGKIETVANKWVQSHHLINNNGNVCLTDKGKFLADGIAADMFQMQ
jgi:oxygen-independent coproporphyrinogen-3 oxidase